MAGRNRTSSRPAPLNLVPGEVKAFSASKSKGCCHRHEETIVVTDSRVLFQWKRWCWGSATYGREEAFNIEDLKFVSLSHGRLSCCGCCQKSLILSLNFSSNGNIMDWNSNGKVSGCRRMIKLHRQEAQETYNQLQAMLQNRLALTVPASGGSGCIKAYIPPQYPANPQPMQQHYPPVLPQQQPVLYATPTAPPVGRTQ